MGVWLYRYHTDIRLKGFFGRELSGTQAELKMNPSTLSALALWLGTTISQSYKLLILIEWLHQRCM
jgi:hypothetical protein